MKKQGHVSMYAKIMLMVIGMMMLCIPAAEAAEYCVSTPGELWNAFLYAAVNGEDDLIKVVQGTYSGSFSFSADEPFALTMRGGYTSGCASRVADPANTIFDGNNTGTALSVGSSKQSNFVLDGLTVQNGKATNSFGGGGLYITTAGGDLVVSNCVIQNNTAPNSDHKGGGVYASGAKNISFSNNAISANSASGYGGGVYVTGANSIISFNSNIITANSASGGSGGGVYVANGAETVTFTNNTFKENSTGSGGGGMYVYYATTVLLNNNTIQANRSERNGSGIAIYGSSGSAVVAGNNSIVKNVMQGYYGNGGGMAIYRVTRVTLTGNRIEENEILCTSSRSIYGGGAYISGAAELNASHNTIRANKLTRTSSYPYDALGGGLYVSASSANLSHNLITGNSAAAPAGDILGGGLYLTGAGFYTLNANEVTANSAGHGGGLYASGSGSLTLVNNVFAANEAGVGGGGLRITGVKTSAITNNTISANTAGDGGGLRIQLLANTDTANLYNNIIWNNSAPNGKDLYVENDGNNDGLRSPVNIFHNDFDATFTTGIWFQIPFLLDASNLNNADPVFVDAGSGNYRLGSGSPCINVGKNDAPSIPELDKDGYARILNTNVDLGAYESGQTVQYGKLSLSSAAYSVNEDGGSVTVTVLRSDGSSGTVTAQYATSDGTAIAGEDYTATSGTLSFASGVTSRSFTIPILKDDLMEGSETVLLTLSSPSGGATLGSPSTAVLTINESGSAAVIMSLTSAAGDPGATGVPVAISLNNAVNAPAVSALELRVRYDAGIGIHASSTQYNLTSRSTGFTAAIKVTESGANSEAHILLYSTEGAVIAPGTGPIFELLFNVDASASSGASSSLSFTQALVSDASGSEIPAQSSGTAAFTVGSVVCQPGDMDCNGQFNVFDLQRLINCIFGSGSCDYGDMNGDGSYNIFDLQQLINKIFNP